MDNKEQLIATILERLNNSEDVVLLSKSEGKEIREILLFYQRAKLMKSIIRYFAMFIAAYLAFKADLISWLPGGDK